MTIRESDTPTAERPPRDPLDRPEPAGIQPHLRPDADPIAPDVEPVGEPPTRRERIPEQARPTLPLATPAVVGRSNWAWGAGLLALLLVIVLVWAF